jgi:hypothetical protein
MKLDSDVFGRFQNIVQAFQAIAPVVHVGVPFQTFNIVNYLPSSMKIRGCIYLIISQVGSFGHQLGGVDGTTTLVHREVTEFDEEDIPKYASL